MDLRHRFAKWCVVDRAPMQSATIADYIARKRATENYRFAKKYVRGKRVLDIGAGYGVGYEHLLAGRPKRVVSVDLFTPAKKAFVRRNVRFVAGDIMRVRLTGKFDVILCFATLYYLKDAKRFFARVRRLLKPGGVFIVNTYSTRVWSHLGVRLKRIGLHNTHSPRAFARLLTRHFGVAPELYVQTRLRYMAGLAVLPLEMLLLPPRLHRWRGADGVYVYGVVRLPP